MTKMLYLLYLLSSIKFIITESTLQSDTKSSNIANESLLIKLDNIKNKIDESALSAVNDKGDNAFPKDAQSDDSELSEIPVDNLLSMVQSELNEAEDADKTKYLDFLTYLTKVLQEDTQKVKVFFKNTWRRVDLGLRGSSKRQRSTTKLQGMLQKVKDIWTSFCRRFFGWTPWCKPDGSEKVIDDLNKLDHEEKVKLLEKHFEGREEHYKSKNPADSAKTEN